MVDPTDEYAVHQQKKFGEKEGRIRPNIVVVSLTNNSLNKTALLLPDKRTVGPTTLPIPRYLLSDRSTDADTDKNRSLTPASSTPTPIQVSPIALTRTSAASNQEPTRPNTNFLHKLPLLKEQSIWSSFEHHNKQPVVIADKRITYNLYHLSILKTSHLATV